MQVIITEKEINVIKNQIETILPYINELFEENIKAGEIIPEIMRKLNGEWLENSVIFTISEEKVCAFFDLLESIYSLAFKVAKIVKPTIELVVDICKEDFVALEEKFELFMDEIEKTI